MRCLKTLDLYPAHPKGQAISRPAAQGPGPRSTQNPPTTQKTPTVAPGAQNASKTVRFPRSKSAHLANRPVATIWGVAPGMVLEQVQAAGGKTCSKSGFSGFPTGVCAPFAARHCEHVVHTILYQNLKFQTDRRRSCEGCTSNTVATHRWKGALGLGERVCVCKRCDHWP